MERFIFALEPVFWKLRLFDFFQQLLRLLKFLGLHIIIKGLKSLSLSVHVWYFMA